jgi:phosphatidylinositol alpha-mannosyltransferase
MKADEPLRICIVATYDLAEEGGVKKHAMHLATQLRALGDHVDVLGPYSGREPLPEGTYGLGGVVNIPSNGSDNRLALFSSPLTVRRRMRQGRYDVVHVQAPEVPPVAWYATWFAGDAARIATFHAYSENEGRASSLARRFVVTPLLRAYDRGIAVSPAAAAFARASWPRPLPVIPNGVDTQRFAPGPAGDARDGGARPLRLLFVGHWRDPRKGLGVLLDAYASLRAAGMDLTLDVIGHGPAAERRNLPGLTYHGAISDEAALARAYRACDLFVAPSTGMESFGIVLLEAMASARPIVCSDIDGYRAVVPTDGARLVPPCDAAALAAAITELAPSEALRRRLGEANRRAALAYDWSRLGLRVREQYRLALDERRGLPRRPTATPPLSAAP